jgi:hypothetical protein
MRVTKYATELLEGRLPIDVHNMMLLVDELIDTYIDRHNEASEDTVCRGKGGVTSFDILKRCYLEPAAFVEVYDENINLYEIWAAFALARVSDAICCLMGKPIDRTLEGSSNKDDAVHYEYAGDSIAQALESVLIVECLKNGLPIDGETAKQYKERKSQIKRVAAKKSRASQVRLIKQKAFELYATAQKDNPHLNKTQCVDSMLLELESFREDHEIISVAYDNLHTTVMKWLREKEQWETRKRPDFFATEEGLLSF